ncbi:MAG TPA: methionine--tRNA ligase [Alphaproteobacteria bacterium]|nr:methionine--tRNA ligase [Alphaproteobacteria bacterium]
MTGQSYYITTPIYYVNDVPHIGHAYTTLACDVLARFMRLDGRDVKFLTGTDEHGQKIEKAAAAAGMTPLDFASMNSANFRKLAELMNYSNDDFIRTTEPRHVKAAQKLWEEMKARGHIYLGSYAGWYAVRDEAFYGEGELIDGPNGKKVAPTGADVEWVEEPSYFFDLSKWQDKLLAYYDAHPDFIAPASRYNEVKSFVKGGLQDLSISRTSFTWGIPVPGDEKHVMYVWLDALTNYMSAVGYPDTKAEAFTKYWPADLHMVGKDILRFHAVYWPAFLMAADLPVPERVFAHGWWTNEGQKISKSLGNVIDPIKLVETYGLDAVRYFLLREVPFGNDGDFSHKQMINRINADLANSFGNLAQRTLSMIAKNCDGKVPQPGAFSADDEALLAQSEELLGKLRENFAKQVFHDGLEEIWVVVRAANAYVDTQAPWTLRKTDPARMATVLYVLAETVRRLSLLLQAVTPDAAAKLLDQLAVPPGERGFASFGKGHMLPAGTALPAPAGVFPRYVEPA